jgi:hypothetical protein
MDGDFKCEAQRVQGSHGGSGCWLPGKVVKMRWKEWKTKPSMDGDFECGVQRVQGSHGGSGC